MTSEKDSTTAVPGGNAAATSESTADSPAAVAARQADDLPEDLAGAYRKLLADRQELYDRLLRKQAEFENFRKRTEREKEDILKHGSADLIRGLLPALDSFERALKQRNPNIPPEFYKGIDLIHNELVEVLRKAGLDPLHTLGETFDPNFHQAVETVESSQHRHHEIVEELQRGYRLRQRLLRPAVVKVAVEPSTGSDKAEKAGGRDSK